ncbi:MAG TPA: glycosyltransferase family 2 protein [bacterium]|nr:glycosyltransferase family 2 protein [bacterium]
MKLVSIVTGCYNEETNVGELYERIKQVFAQLAGYEFELICADNASQDNTVWALRGICKRDKRVKVIVNARNFGHVRSGYHAALQARGDAVVTMASDLQDPPELIKEFVSKWEQGYKAVMAVKSKSEEPALIYAIRRFYYRLLRRLSDVELVENATGFGLYDKQIFDILRKLDDPYPYFRGQIAEIGFDVARVEFTQQRRKRGFTKNNFYTLFDMALLGMTSHSKVPLRLATMLGFASAALSLLVALFYLAYKLVFWKSFELGLAPLVVGIFFFSSVQLFFLGIVGEYVGSIHTYVRHMPLVIEKERINFD